MHFKNLANITPRIALSFQFINETKSKGRRDEKSRAQMTGGVNGLNSQT